jgi:hypothetical protein
MPTIHRPDRPRKAPSAIYVHERGLITIAYPEVARASIPAVPRRLGVAA